MFYWYCQVSLLYNINLGPAFSQRLRRTFILWTFSIDCFQGQEVGNSEIVSRHFFSSFTFVGGNISIKEGNFLSFYQIQRCYGTFVTNSLFIIILVSRDHLVAIIDENKSWWLFERSGRCSQESCLMVTLLCLKLLIVFLRVLPPFVSKLSLHLLATNCERKRERHGKCLKYFCDWSRN